MLAKTYAHVLFSGEGSWSGDKDLMIHPSVLAARLRRLGWETLFSDLDTYTMRRPTDMRTLTFSLIPGE